MLTETRATLLRFASGENVTSLTSLSLPRLPSSAAAVATTIDADSSSALSRTTLASTATTIAGAAITVPVSAAMTATVWGLGGSIIGAGTGAVVGLAAGVVAAAITGGAPAPIAFGILKWAFFSGAGAGVLAGLVCGGANAAANTIKNLRSSTSYFQAGAPGAPTLTDRFLKLVSRLEPSP
jgi:hypothetical protein